MSNTIVDMPKVSQMLDAGWTVSIYKGQMGSYEVRAMHEKPKRMKQAIESLEKVRAEQKKADPDSEISPAEVVEMFDLHDGWLMTDDFTPEQALTRMAYKTFGQIL